MGESVENNIQRRRLLRQVQECLARPLDGEARERFLAEGDAIIDTTNPPPSVASKRKAFKIV
jgi:hypothetical protein